MIGLVASVNDLQRAETAAKQLESDGGPVDLTEGGSRPGLPTGCLLSVTLGQVHVDLVGESGNFASWLYIAAVKMNSLEKIESDLSELVEAMKTSPTFSQFTD
ncbi:Uncharacterized protein Rs2_47130 [Raphanus sativus]|nr:Uncharacterized protein Rs2_47130 [Raphanus sativus]